MLDDGVDMGDVESVFIDHVTHGHETPLGPYLLGADAWRRLGMPGFLRGIGFSHSQSLAAQALVLGRMAEPMSEHAFHGHIQRTSLPDLLGDRLLNISLDSLYRAGDRLLANRDKIERHMRDAALHTLGLSRTIFLYDLTNFHFEGECAANGKAVRGKNKQKRSDCPQVVAAVVFDNNGFEMLHRTFPGNMSDSKSLVEIVDAMSEATMREGELAFDPPTVIVDGGISSEKNVGELAARGFHYIVHDRRPMRGAWAAEFASDGFTAIPGRGDDEAVLVKDIDVAAEDGRRAERILLCKSGGREKKESAIFSKAEERLVADLKKLGAGMGKRGAKTLSAANQAIGRLRERHSRAARFYEITAAAADDGTPALAWRRLSDQIHSESGLRGGYVLRTDRLELGGDELWRLYMTLTKAEDGFRSLKGEIGLRPVFHQKEGRVDAHVFITIIAYQMMRFCLWQLEKAGDNRSWSTIRRLLSTHCYSTIFLPLADGTAIKLRKPGIPEGCQAEIYGKLGMGAMADLPKSKTVIARPRP